MFLLLRASEIKALPIQMPYSRTYLNKKFVLFSSEQLLDEVIIHVNQIYKTIRKFRFIE